MEKRTQTIVLHVTESTAAQIRALAELGQTTVSELGGEVMACYLRNKRDEYEGMKKVFGSEQNCE